MQQSSILKSLATCGKDDVITMLVRSMLDGSGSVSLCQGGVKVLSSSGVAPYCDDTIKALEAKHPYKPPPSTPSNTFFEPPLVAEIDIVFGCIKSFPKEFVASAPLTPLLKPDNEIQPIAIGTIWRWLVSKVAMKGVGKEMSKLLSEYHNDGSLEMLTMDFSNAFNLVDRSTLLNETHISGLPSGCSKVTHWDLFFSLVLHPLVHKIRDSCKLLLHAWYLDDETVIGDSKEVVRVLDIIKVSGPGLGLKLNIKKTNIFWPSCKGVTLREGLFPVDIRRPSLGVKLLGGAVSRDIHFISGMAVRGVVNVVDFMSLLPQLHDPKSELLLLRSCMGIAKLLFDLRTCQPVHIEETTLFFDKDLHELIENIVDFLPAIPIDMLGQHMSLVEYNIILKYRLMIPLFSVDAICPVCRKACLDSFMEHAVQCKELPSFKYRHDMVRDVLYDICRRVGISAKKEAHVNFLTDPSDDNPHSKRLTFWFLDGLEGNMRAWI
ncbi:hypothetical protein Tco_0503070 [Tanacetum coccineum]